MPRNERWKSFVSEQCKMFVAIFASHQSKKSFAPFDCLFFVCCITRHDATWSSEGWKLRKPRRCCSGSCWLTDFWSTWEKEQSWSKYNEVNLKSKDFRVAREEEDWKQRHLQEASISVVFYACVLSFFEIWVRKSIKTCRQAAPGKFRDLLKTNKARQSQRVKFLLLKKQKNLLVKVKYLPKLFQAFFCRLSRLRTSFFLSSKCFQSSAPVCNNITEALRQNSTHGSQVDPLVVFIWTKSRYLINQKATLLSHFEQSVIFCTVQNWCFAQLVAVQYVVESSMKTFFKMLEWDSFHWQTSALQLLS